MLKRLQLNVMTIFSLDNLMQYIIQDTSCHRSIWVRLRLDRSKARSGEIYHYLLFPIQISALSLVGTFSLWSLISSPSNFLLCFRRVGCYCRKKMQLIISIVTNCQAVISTKTRHFKIIFQSFESNFFGDGEAFPAV